MLTFNLSRIFKARSIDKPSQYLIRLGFSRNMATSFKQGNARLLNLNHVELLCDNLKCTPNDMLEWVPSKEQENISNHPLEALRHRNKATEVVKLINDLPFDKLQQIEEMIKTIQ
ncbi:hypothetical protein BH11BAC6_BH11BAC6_02840 [soil metagenome]